MTKSVWSLILGLTIIGCLVSRAAEPKSDKTSTVVAEGVGKDEKEARKAAFRDAVSKVVGTLVDAETLVKNDEIISERILEYSGGFIKSYDTLKTEKTADGLFRVRIKAIVERTQIVGKLSDAKVTSKEVKGSDLLAEKMTKEEARKNATELLAKLYSDLPKIAKAEVLGKPQLTDDGKGLNVEIVVSADAKAYTEFVKKSTELLDKLSIHKDSAFLTATKHQDGSFGWWGQRTPFDKPELGQATPRGYTVWLMTFVDGSGMKTRWNFYWVDADIMKTLKPILGKKHIHIEMLDAEAKLITEDEIPVDPNGAGGEWFLFGGCPRQYFVDREKRETVSLFIAPLRGRIDPNNFANSYYPNLSFRRKILLTDKELERVKAIKASVILKQSEKIDDR